MKRAKFILIILLVFLVNFSSAMSATLVTVNDYPISEATLGQEKIFLTADAARRNLIKPSGQHAAVNNRELIEILIDRQLLLQEAQRRKVPLKSTLVRKAWRDFLHLQHEDPTGLFAGLDHQAALGRIKSGLLIERLLQRTVLRSLNVSNQEIETFYESNPDLLQTRYMIRARHIMIKVSGSATDEEKLSAYDKISHIQQLALDGNNFAALAVEYSECPSKSRGGDLGFFSRDQVIDEFGQAAFSLPLGHLSPIFETRFGYHLIMVTDSKPAELMSLEQARPLIKRLLYHRKAKDAVNTFLKKLRQQARIVWLTP